ncbi:hypothetical protein CC78DRAFT_616265 [Lojkania enalia]|uniref:DUF3074 domain-containing protein n=1 Tax=Lojkania enalia TaxID=147567 RepID=A0A9P4KA35_9PLEO|nr:hypothetical protein CC78DRAFT_616265 [Didymosphaeria enalia]
MSELHKALECLRPKDFSEIPTDELNIFLSDIFSRAELIVNSVPPPPNGMPYESSQRTRTDPSIATSAEELTISKVRRPPVHQSHKELQKSWGKPLKMSAKDNATGITVYKMAGHDRHGAWFARTSVHEGLGFAKWKRAMMKEFLESLAVEGGPGEGNVRGIGGDKRLEDINVEGVGKLEVYQLSAQFPGPTSPREFITLLLTSGNCLTDASKIGSNVLRHYMVVSIPVSHPDAPPRNGLIRGYYESVEMIREIPVTCNKPASASTSDLSKHEQKKFLDRCYTTGFAESRGSEAKAENIDRKDSTDDDEANPVEWIMVTRSDPGGGIPRFMVERNTPSSIVQDAVKFLDWACRNDHFPTPEDEGTTQESLRMSLEMERAYSISEANGYLAGVGTSIAERPLSHHRRHSHRTIYRENEPGIIRSVNDTANSYFLDSLNLLQRADSHSSTTTVSSTDSFASAEQFNTAPDGLPTDESILTPSTTSDPDESLAPSESRGTTGHGAMSRELQKIEQKRQHLKEKLAHAREKAGKETQDASLKSAKELEKVTEKHIRERKKQEDKFAKEIQKLEARRERETKKLVAKQQKEADKNNLLKAQRERDEWKQQADLTEQENKLLKEQIGGLQRENTALVARLGKMKGGIDILSKVREDIEGKGRKRVSSRGSVDSRGSRQSWGKASGHSHSHSNLVLNESLGSG